MTATSPERAKRAGGVTGKGFQPGQSGNPGGRSKGQLDVQAAAREHTYEAVERLAFWMRSSDATASVQAAKALLERAWGKPMQPVEHSGADGGPIRTEQVGPPVDNRPSIESFLQEFSDKYEEERRIIEAYRAEQARKESEDA